MARYNGRLDRREVEKLFHQLCFAISDSKTIQESADFLRDLLSYQEAEMIAKRLKIAGLLLENSTYEEIKEKLKVSFGTISRVQEWLKISGDGYRKAIEGIKRSGVDKPKKMKNNPATLSAIKKRYPMYYWPEILLDNIARNMNKRQKNEVRKVISQMDKMKEKTALYKKLKLLGF